MLTYILLRQRKQLSIKPDVNGCNHLIDTAPCLVEELNLPLTLHPMLKHLFE